jgi:hypothetical protein
MNTDHLYGHNPYIMRQKDALDPEELQNRVGNYLLCWKNFNAWNATSDRLAASLRRPDIDNQCHKERASLIAFANETGLRYENVWAPLNRDLERLYKQ